jgi:hypothetical protein
VGKVPRPLDKELLAEEIERMSKILQATGPGSTDALTAAE